jgi:hypothetical protein
MVVNAKWELAQRQFRQTILPVALLLDNANKRISVGWDNASLVQHHLLVLFANLMATVLHQKFAPRPALVSRDLWMMCVVVAPARTARPLARCSFVTQQEMADLILLTLTPMLALLI